jgi:predicted RNA binding protein YcfA (HicA-like mRNA interferase family)
MGKCPPLKPREVALLLQALGFIELRRRGSHRQYRHPDGRCTTVPWHQGRDISPVLIRQIAEEIGIALDDFLKAR